MKTTEIINPASSTRDTAEQPPPLVSEGRFVSPGGREENRQRLSLFDVETPRRKFSGLILPEETMRQLRALLVKIKHHHTLYVEFGLNEVDPTGGRTAINLYGPPGTGKSFAAEAIADELGLRMIRANYAEIESKYVGETAKNIKAAFQKARETKALLFFDEADSILGKRLTDITRSTDHAVNVSRSVMLLELDQFTGVTVFATNLASNYDTAFVRRILGHVAFPLPDADGRMQLWRAHIPQKMPVGLSERDWQMLAGDSEGLSGGDILNAVIRAASSALEREGVECTVTLEDFQLAIGAARAAHESIGIHPGR